MSGQKDDTELTRLERAYEEARDRAASAYKAWVDAHDEAALRRNELEALRFHLSDSHDDLAEGAA